jgi:hypothetical protein
VVYTLELELQQLQRLEQLARRLLELMTLLQPEHLAQWVQMQTYRPLNHHYLFKFVIPFVSNLFSSSMFVTSPFSMHS